MSKNVELVKLMIDTVKGAPTNYSVNDANEVIRNAVLDIFQGDKSLKKRVWDAHKNEFFALLEEVLEQSITTGYNDSNFYYGQFVEERNLALGDENIFYVPDATMLVVSEISGGHHNLQRQRLDSGSEFTVSTKDYGIKIYEYTKRLLSGRVDWVAFVSKIDQSIKNHKYDLITTAFLSAPTYLPTELKATGTFSKAAALTAISKVEAANAGKEIVLVGTKVAINKMIGTVDIAFSEEMKNAKNTLGYVPVWEGYRCVVLPQVFKENTFEFAFADDKVLILPVSENKPIKLVNSGTVEIAETSDKTGLRDKSVEYEVMFGCGIACIFNELFGTIEV